MVTVLSNGKYMFDLLHAFRTYAQLALFDKLQELRTESEYGTNTTLFAWVTVALVCWTRTESLEQITTRLCHPFFHPPPHLTQHSRMSRRRVLTGHYAGIR